MPAPAFGFRRSPPPSRRPSPVWTTVTNAPIIVGGNNHVTLPSSGENWFYRLTVEWKAEQPGGRKRIAQRFIAGSGWRNEAESRRDDRIHPHWTQREFFRPCGTFVPPALIPAMNRWAIFERPYGTQFSPSSLVCALPVHEIMKTEW